VKMDPEELAQELYAARERGKLHAIVVVAEGAHHNARALGQYFRENQKRLGFDLRVTQLGHVQRGGSPGAFDRLLATRLGAAAVQCLAAGESGVLVGQLKGAVAATPLEDVASQKKPLDPSLFALARTMSS
jgi:6-phosphofructokinase 1